MATQNRTKPAKVKIVETLPSLNYAELGELYYDSSNTKLALRTITGWIYFTKD